MHTAMALPGPTLCVEVGVTALRAQLVDERGAPIEERHRLALPRTQPPKIVVEAVAELAGLYEHYERLSLGFPGVVMDGVVREAPSHDPAWSDFALERALSVRLERLVRVANAADMQGLGIVEGKGVELVLTFGVGLGSALFVDGRLVPNLQLGRHPFRKKRSYDEYVGHSALKAAGAKRWGRRVMRVVEQVLPIWNPRVLYLGGPNAKRIPTSLPPGVQRVSGNTGLAGGFRLWDH